MLAWRSRIVAQLQLQDPERRHLLRIAARHWQAQASTAAAGAAADPAHGQHAAAAAPAGAEAAARKGDAQEAGADQEGKQLPAEQAAEAAAEAATAMDMEPAGQQQAAAPAADGPADMEAEPASPGRATGQSQLTEAGGACQRPAGARETEAAPLVVGAAGAAVAGHAQEQASLQRQTSQAAHGSTAMAAGAQRSTSSSQQGGSALKAAALTAQQKLRLGRLEQALQAKLQVSLASHAFNSGLLPGCFPCYLICMRSRHVHSLETLASLSCPQLLL